MIFRSALVTIAAAFALWNVIDALLIPARVWRAAVLWRWCFLIGFVILGPVSLIVGLCYRLHYRRRLQFVLQLKGAR